MKLTITQLARMSQLLASTKTEIRLPKLEEQIMLYADETRRAGVYEEAAVAGLTMAQWEIVRNPEEAIRKAVLAAGN